MKILYLFRHAKSSWDDTRLADEERPLTLKGIRKTILVSEYLKANGIKPGMIISSHAVRAFETAVLVAAGLGYPKDRIRVERKVYDGYYDRILDVIYSIPNEFETLMVIGHNPTITQLANLFLNPGIEPMDTSSVVAIRFDTDRWEGIPMCDASKEFVVTPKLLKNQK
jgi:phosphohistidine phosphatase